MDRPTEAIEAGRKLAPDWRIEDHGDGRLRVRNRYGYIADVGLKTNPVTSARNRAAAQAVDALPTLLRYIEHLEIRTPETVGTLEVWKDGPYLKWGMSSADSSDGIDPTDLPDGTYHIVGPIPTPEEDHGE